MRNFQNRFARTGLTLRRGRWLMTTSNGIEDFNNRLGLRLDEFCTLTGMSKPTLWRRIKSGDVRIVRIGGMPFITRAELVRLGLIDLD